MKKILSLLLVVAMVATMVPVLAVGAVAADTATHVDVGTESTYTDANSIAYTVIDSAEKFLKYDGTENIILAGNIDLSAAKITKAIATLGDGVIIDGNGYSVTNFTMEGAADAEKFSLFDVTNDAAVTIRDITFGTSEENGAIGYTFQSSTTTYVAGGFLFAKVTCNATVENVAIYANMDTSKVATGMIAGEYSGTLNLTDVKLYGALTGVNSGNSAQGAFVGRLLGPATLKGCENHATVSATGNKAAGFFGQTYLSGSVSFEKCVNYGALKLSAYQNAGGFIGQISNKTGNTYTFTSCVNRGNVSGKQNVGGFVGTTDASLNFEKCFNYGEVTGSGNTAGAYPIGGLIGNANLKTGSMNLCIENCVNYGSIDAANNGNGGIAGMIGYLYLSSAAYAADESVTFTECLNYGIVGSDRTTHNAGGMVGRLYSNGGNSTKAIAFDGCLNYGQIKVTGQQVGGLIGSACNIKWAIDIENSANFGNIQGNQTGGAIGNVSGTITTGVTVKKFLNMGNMTSGNSAGGIVGVLWVTGGTYSFDTCVNFGAVTGKADKDANLGLGGLVGGVHQNCSSFQIHNSLNAGSVSKVTSCGNFVAVSGKATGSNNWYVAVDGATSTDCVEDANNLKTLAAAMEKYNDGTSFKDVFDIHGEVMLNSDGNGAVLATPAFVGVQKTNALEDDGTYSIRFVSVINTARYSKVGYKIQVNDATEKAIYCTTAYTAISETVDGKVNTHNASSLGGKYVYALNVDGLDPNESYTFKVTAVAVGTAEDGADEYIGKSYTFTYVNGVFGGYIENSEVQS